MIFGLSLGCCYKFIPGINRDDIITFYRENFSNEIQGIEIMIPYKNLKNFKLSKENREWLKELTYISYHCLPTGIWGYLVQAFHLIRNRLFFVSCCYHYKDKDIWVLKLLSKLYSKNILMENIDTEKLWYSTYYKDMCFDTSHALGFGEHYTKKLFNNTYKRRNNIISK